MSNGATNPISYQSAGMQSEISQSTMQPAIYRYPGYSEQPAMPNIFNPGMQSNKMLRFPVDNSMMSLISGVIQPLIQLVFSLVSQLTGSQNKHICAQPGMLPTSNVTSAAATAMTAETGAAQEAGSKKEGGGFIDTAKQVWGGIKDLYGGVKDYFKDFSFSKIGDYVSDAWGWVKSLF